MLLVIIIQQRGIESRPVEEGCITRQNCTAFTGHHWQEGINRTEFIIIYDRAVFGFSFFRLGDEPDIVQVNDPGKVPWKMISSAALRIPWERSLGCACLFQDHAGQWR